MCYAKSNQMLLPGHFIAQKEASNLTNTTITMAVVRVKVSLRQIC